MGQQKNKFTKIFFPIICLVIFACTPLCFALSSKVQNVFAATSDIVEVSISNKDFDSSSSSSLQSSPSGWNKIETSDGVKSGIISVDETDFSNNKNTYGLEIGQNPGRGGTVASDKHILMVNAQKNYVKAGFESSSSTSLEANSFYVVAINTKTTSSSFASLYVDGLVDNYDATNSFSKVNFQQWTKNYFFIRTGATKKDIKIQMYLGSKNTPSTSAVFFDNIEFFRTSESSYENLLTQQVAENATRPLEAKTYREINLVDDYVDITSKIGNANFNDPSTSVLSPIFDTSAKFVDVRDNSKYSNLSSNNSFAFMIKNEQKSYSCYELKDIVVPAYGVYAVSVDAKIIEAISSSNATLKLVESDEIKKDYPSYEPKSAELTISSNTNAVKNDFNTYTFFIKGNGLKETKFSLQVSIGTKDSKATGEIALDDIKFFSMTSKEYNGATGSFQKTIDLNLSSASPLIANGHFNNYTVSTPVEFVAGKPAYAFPYEVEKWTHEVDPNVSKTDIAFGAINTQSKLYNATMIGTANPQNPDFNIVDPDTHEANANSNNILMFKNLASTHQSASLSSISLEASSTYELTFDCKTELNAGALSFSVISDSKTISKFSEINTNGDWKKYKVAIRTNAASTNIDIKFNFGTQTQNAIGFGFVDNVRLVKKALTDEQFLSLENQNNTKIVDFKNGNWKIVSDTQNTFGVWELLTSSSSLCDGAFAGVISAKENAFGVVGKNEDNNMLIVSNTEKGTSSITTKNDFHFTKDKFYKISLNILTQRMQTLTNEDDKELTFGASLKLSGFDTTLKNIVTNGEFKTYTFLLKATEDGDQGLTLTVSSPTSQTLGTAIVDNLVVTELDQAEYDEAVALKESKKQANVAVVETSSKDDKTDDKTDEANETNKLSNKEIWLLVPSIIFGVAVIGAILAFTLRHIKIKKFEKSTQATYNRKSSLEREKAKIEAKKNIDKQIAEQVELQKIVENELATLEENYQKDLQEFRSHGNSKSSKMEKEFKSYMNEKSKLDATLNSIKEKIKQLENPELLVLEEKKIYLKYQKEQERVDRHIKRETKKLNKDKKKQK